MTQETLGHIIGLIIIFALVWIVARSSCELTIIQCGWETVPYPEYYSR